MSWLSRGTDERLVRAMQERREVLRGPLPRGGSPYAEPTTTDFLSRAFGITTLTLIILVVLLAASTAYYAQHSGALRWLLFGLVVSAVGFAAVRALGAAVRDPMRLGGRRSVAAGVGGDLAALRTTLHRAQGGLTYSQLVFEDRMREAFLEKVRVHRDVPEEAILAASRDPEALQTLLRDRELTAFVLESARNFRLYPSTTPALPKKDNFLKHVASLLDRMEGWR